MGQLSVFSPAKINLFLAVLGRMPNGFHELASLVAQLDFGDRLEIETQETGRSEVTLVCDDDSLPVDSGNLAYAAAEGFLLRSGLPWSVTIRLEKRIPHGAGLGGGSSNAAAVLRGLSQLAEESGQLGISRGELLELAAELGSDCPLFLDSEPKIMRGRGERLASIAQEAKSDLSGRNILLFKPSFPISTVWAYRRLAEGSDSYDEKGWAEGRLESWEKGELSLNALLYNRFESVAFEKYQAYGPLFEAMREAGAAPLMSGSGSSCFALLDSGVDPDKLKRLARESWGDRAFVERARIVA